MSKFFKRVKENFLYPLVLLKHKNSVTFLMIGCFIALSTHVFASDDILDGTAKSLTATLNGTGKTYLYIAEGILSLAAYIKTKNLLFLAGIVVVACFFNIMMKVAGVAG